MTINKVINGPRTNLLSLSSEVSNLDARIQKQFNRIQYASKAEDELYESGKVFSDETRAFFDPKNQAVVLKAELRTLGRAYKEVRNANFKTLGFWGWLSRFLFGDDTYDRIVMAMDTLKGLNQVEKTRKFLIGRVLNEFQSSTGKHYLGAVQTIDCYMDDPERQEKVESEWTELVSFTSNVENKQETLRKMGYNLRPLDPNVLSPLVGRAQAIVDANARIKAQKNAKAAKINNLFTSLIS